jgi:thiol-disulfide isomerase/thioredoxin
LTQKPTLLTAVLSLATLAGYAAYRFTLGGPEEPTPTDPAVLAQLVGIDEHDDEHEDAMPYGVDSLAALPEIGLNDLSGAPKTLADFEGKALVINFWATWCAPCLREIPLLKTFHSENSDVDVIGIAVDRLEPVREYADEMQFNYPILIGPTGPAEGMNVMGAFENIAGVMPFSVFVAADGSVLGNHAGELHPEHLEAVAAAVEALGAGEIDLATARSQVAELL